MKKNRLSVRMLVPAAVVLVLIMAMASGANITSSDPLVSLSYLQGTFKTAVMKEVQSTIDAKSAQLESSLNQRINGIRTASTPQISATATHMTATIPANANYTIPGNSEFLFLSGAVVVNAAGLSDLTDGTPVAIQGELKPNHLYAAATSVTLKASEPAKILIRK